MMCYNYENLSDMASKRSCSFEHGISCLQQGNFTTSLPDAKKRFGNNGYIGVYPGYAGRMDSSGYTFWALAKKLLTDEDGKMPVFYLPIQK